MLDELDCIRNWEAQNIKSVPKNWITFVWKPENEHFLFFDMDWWDSITSGFKSVCDFVTQPIRSALWVERAAEEHGKSFERSTQYATNKVDESLTRASNKMVDNNRVDTRDISSGIEKSGLHIKQGIEEASRNVQAGIEQGGKNIQIGIETGARKFSKSVEDHGNSVRVGMSEASEVFGHKFHETGIHASNTLQHESQRWRSFASQYILIY